MIRSLHRPRPGAHRDVRGVERKQARGTSSAGESKGGAETRAHHRKQVIKAQNTALKALGFAKLREQISNLSDEQVFALIRETELRQRSPNAKSISKLGDDLGVGRIAMTPIRLVRPGQTQLSAANVRAKMIEFLERLHARRKEAKHDFKGSKAELFEAEEAMTAVVGPGGRYLVLTDGHHHVAALKALQAMVGRVVGDGLAFGPRLETGRPGDELRFIRRLFGGGDGVPNIPIHIVGDYSSRTPQQFWQELSEVKDRKQLLYLDTRDGHRVAVPPARFSDLENNPFRFLVSQLTGKLRIDPDHQLDIRGAAKPVWLKVIGHAPDFIEFHLARILEAAFRAVGLEYDPTRPPNQDERTVARWALFHAIRDPSHPLSEVTGRVMVLTKERHHDNLRQHIEIERDRIHVPSRLYRPSRRRLKKLEQAVELIAKKHGRKLPGLG